MKELIEIALLFGLFGLLFLIAGARRLLAARSGNAIGSVFWGSTGVAIGLAFSVRAYWFAVMAAP
jgi:hypothetical protein